MNEISSLEQVNTYIKNAISLCATITINDLLKNFPEHKRGELVKVLKKAAVSFKGRYVSGRRGFPTRFVTKPEVWAKTLVSLIPNDLTDGITVPQGVKVLMVQAYGDSYVVKYNGEFIDAFPDELEFLSVS